MQEYVCIIFFLAFAFLFEFWYFETDPLWELKLHSLPDALYLSYIINSLIFP